MKTREIANFLEGDLLGDGEIEISRIASLENSQKGDLSFVENSTFLQEEPNSIAASCLLVPADFSSSLPVAQIKVDNPKLSFAKIAEVLYPPKIRGSNAHESSVISESAEIGNDVFLGAFCSVGENSVVGNGTQLRASAKIGDNVKIGENCVLHPNAFVDENCTIGNNVTLHAGVVIGSDGFGFVRDENSYVKFPQIGTVVIEDNVEIGANSCVDRGALGETRIGEGTKIDNLVQIAHNVSIGKRVVIAAQTGISGSVTIEDDCVIGGQVGFGDHSLVKSGAIIGSKAGILPGKIVREGVWWGVPVQPLSDFKRQNAYVKSLPRLKRQLKELERKISDLENK